MEIRKYSLPVALVFAVCGTIKCAKKSRYVHLEKCEFISALQYECCAKITLTNFPQNEMCLEITVVPNELALHLNVKNNGDLVYSGKIERMAQVQLLKKLTQNLEKSNQAISLNLLSDVEEEDVTYLLYRKGDTTGVEVTREEVEEIETNTKFDKSLPTLFIVHGWINNCQSSTIITDITSAILENHDVNVFSVCWDEYAYKDYISSFAAVAPVGRYLGEFVLSLSTLNNYDLGKITIVGHSLGAHIAGYAGKQTNGTLDYIVGLDPAGPLFFEQLPDSRLSITDANYVQVIHTDASFLGVNFEIGHIDFWPNGGFNQPGCDFDIVGTCSHGRSHQYYTESLLNDSFVSRQCDSYNNYIGGKCTNNSKIDMGGYVLDISKNEIVGNFPGSFRLFFRPAR
ncbi:phospholipase A1-like isoform X3 [Cylas formicarius]|uniref:phospholipase A1-like isoform X3 n=1 Tax=Cylas formicarius TaxID=197179 RepID=UPI002958B936|nr:phospholipase A1-like isoform X3 [Cylas formicarius]